MKTEQQIPGWLQEMADRWPSTVVSRQKVEIFSGGMLSGKTVANFESEGLGPHRIKVGSKVGYPVQGLIEWMAKRSLTFLEES